MLRATTSCFVSLLATSCGRPVLRSMPVAQLVKMNGAALITWPFVRSMTYAKPLRSACMITLRG
jgi:hypothetical protein